MTITPVARRAPGSNGLYDVLDLILDKGLVIDAYVRVSVIGLEVLSIDLRVVVASVDTYLRFAEAVDRINLGSGSKGLPEFIEGMTSSVASGKTKGIASGAKESMGDAARQMGSSMRDKMGEMRDAGDESEVEEAEEEEEE
jgi:gas vesicle structural protein